MNNLQNFWKYQYKSVLPIVLFFGLISGGIGAAAGYFYCIKECEDTGNITLKRYELNGMVDGLKYSIPPLIALMEAFSIVQSFYRNQEAENLWNIFDACN